MTPTQDRLRRNNSHFGVLRGNECRRLGPVLQEKFTFYWVISHRQRQGQRLRLEQMLLLRTPLSIIGRTTQRDPGLARGWGPFCLYLQRSNSGARLPCSCSLSSPGVREGANSAEPSCRLGSPRHAGCRSISLSYVRRRTAARKATLRRRRSARSGPALLGSIFVKQIKR